MGGLSALLAVVGCALCFVFCDSMAALWGKKGNLWALAALIIFSPAGYLMFGYLNMKFKLALVAGWVNVLIAIGTILVGWLAFREQLSSRELCGLGLAIVAIAVLMTGK